MSNHLGISPQQFFELMVPNLSKKQIISDLSKNSGMSGVPNMEERENAYLAEDNQRLHRIIYRLQREKDTLCMQLAAAQAKLQEYEEKSKRKSIFKFFSFNRKEPKGEYRKC